MKYSIALVAAALASFGAAQDLSGIPSCAIPCINDATASSTTCGATDFACSCEPDNMSKITAAATTCVFAKCSSDDAVKTLSGTKALCDSLPATPASSSAEAPAPSATEAPSSEAPAPSSTEAPSSEAPAPSSTEAPATSEAPVPTSSAVGAPVTVYVTVCGSSTKVAPQPTNAGNGTGSPTATQAPVFTGAASKMTAGLGSIFALGLAALAL